jgi:RimJ/RimL family protein N-acetyltransferase
MRELPFPAQPLADSVVGLRPWRESDVPRNLMQYSDPLTLRFSWRRSAPYTGADAREYFLAQERGRLHGKQVDFALVDPLDERTVLGGASLYDVQDGRAAVGYWLAAQARGRGVVTHAVRLIAAWAFDELGIARLELTCAPDNHASQRVAERCGFTREGVLRSHTNFKGGRRDTVVFSLLPSELP